MVVTHRGRNTNFRENTISSFNHALELGAQGIECDLRLTLDNKVVVYHDKNLNVNGRKTPISKTHLKNLDEKNLLTLEELFEYINCQNIPFYLELKDPSQVLVEKIINKIENDNLWERVYIIGFSFFVDSAVKAQWKYPKLKVIQILTIPLYSYVRKPAQSLGVAFGWFDSWPTTEWLFRRLISIERLARIRKFYERNGFNKVMAGVINNKSGFEYFRAAGITDIVTDNVADAVSCFKLS